MQDTVPGDAPETTLGDRVKSFKRHLRATLARARLITMARAVRPASFAARFAATPRLDAILLADDTGQEACGVGSLARQVLPVGATHVVRAREGVQGPLHGVLAALQATHAPLVALGNASAEWEDDAALWIALAFARRPRAAALFADHASAGVPVHKPDFSWAYLLARNFVGPVVVYARATLLAAVESLLASGWRPPTAESAAYAIALEALHGTAHDDVLHVRHPLWLTTAERPDPSLADVAAAALRRRGVEARVSRRADDPRLHDVWFTGTSSTRVSIVIPTKNAGELVEKCIADLRATAGHESYEVVVIDHESDEPRLLGYLARESAAGRLRVFPYRGPFNYAAMNNAAIRSLDTELVLLLNNDVDGFSDGWLAQMVATLQLDEAIAAVGGLLHYPDGTIQHAGVILTPKRPCIAAHVGLPHDAPGYEGRVRSLQEYSAVTAAFMLVRRAAFDRIGGFDEVFPDDYNDIDLCLRLRAAGHRIVYNPLARASHWESRSRRAKETAKDIYLSRWRDAFSRDPFYSPHLSATAFRPDELSDIWRERKLVSLHHVAGRR